MAHDAYAGCTVEVSTTDQGGDLLLAGFQAIGYVPIPNVQSAPGLGTTRTEVSQTYMVGPTQTKLGALSINGGDLVCGNIPDDPGQVILRAMLISGRNRAFKITRNTTKANGTETTQVLYTRGVVASEGDDGGAVDDVIMSTYTMKFNQVPISVVA